MRRPAIVLVPLLVLALVIGAGGCGDGEAPFSTPTYEVENEIMGTSNGEGEQTFAFAKAPVTRAEIWVNELDALSDKEMYQIIRSGDFDFEEVHDDSGKTIELWVRWQAVDDLSGSSEDDRHYKLDRTTGTVTFGDGVNGRIPPSGASIKADYRAGGGKATPTATPTTTPTLSLTPTPTPTPTPTATPTATPWGTLNENAEHGFSFRYPQGWTEVPHSSPAPEVVVTVASPNGKAIIEVFVFYFAEEAPLEEFVALVKSRALDTVPEFQVISEGEMTSGQAIPAYHMVHRGRLWGIHYKAKAIMTVRGRQGFMINARAELAYFDTYEQAIDQTLYSFRLLPH